MNEFDALKQAAKAKRDAIIAQARRDSQTVKQHNYVKKLLRKDGRFTNHGAVARVTCDSGDFSADCRYTELGLV